MEKMRKKRNNVRNYTFCSGCNAYTVTSRNVRNLMDNFGVNHGVVYDTKGRYLCEGWRDADNYIRVQTVEDMRKKNVPDDIISTLNRRV